MTQRFGRLNWWEQLALYTLGALGSAICSVTAVEAYCVYVPNLQQPHAISVIDTATNSLSATIEVDIDQQYGGPELYGPAVTPDARFLYVANRGESDHPGNTVFVIDTATNTVASTVTVTAGSGPIGIAITPDGAFAYVTGRYLATVMVLDTAKALTDAANALVATINVPGAGALFGSAVSPDGRFAYSEGCATPCDSSNPAGLMPVVDTSSNKIRATLAGVGVGTALALSPNGDLAYLPSFFEDTVEVIDTGKALSDPTHAIHATIAVGSNPYAVALTPDGHFAYVANCGEFCWNDNPPSSISTVSVIDTSTNKVASTISLPASSGPTGVAITPDGAFAYVPTGWDKSVFVIDTAKAVTDPAHSVIKNIALGRPFPNGIAIGSVPGGCAGLNNPTATVTPTLTRTPTRTITRTPPTPVACVGDCNGNGHVLVDELVKGVNIALGTAPLGDCPQFDCNGTGHVTVDCLIKGVNAALNGC
jgi:YVTN family beta-propeller protein